jgi:hypothetical protein
MLQHLLFSETVLYWKAPTGSITDQIAKLDGDRELLIEAGKRGAKFAKSHDFETELSKRMTHSRGFVA